MCFTLQYVIHAKLSLETLTCPIDLDLQDLPKLVVLVTRARDESVKLALQSNKSKRVTRFELSWKRCNDGTHGLLAAMQEGSKACRKQTDEVREVSTAFNPQDASFDGAPKPCLCCACKGCLVREKKWTLM